MIVIWCEWQSIPLEQSGPAVKRMVHVIQAAGASQRRIMHLTRSSGDIHELQSKLSPCPQHTAIGDNVCNAS